ncbi:MAG: DegV family protein [Oscillospiraceae bacterium]|nr:DegV family protein [Oscillospiraceae bacterium]
MTNKILITADSTCDVPADLKERYNFKIIPLTITLKEENYLDGVNFSVEDMYKAFYEDGSLPATAAPNIAQFLDFFKPFINEGYEIIHFDISSALSGTYSAACLAAEALKGVYVIDSEMLSSGILLEMVEAAEAAERGMSPTEIVRYIEDEIRPKTDTSFVLDTLKFMAKGGRCSGVAAMAANILGLRPGLEMKNKELGVYKKYRGNSKAFYMQYVKDRIAGKKIRPGHVFITESGGIDQEIISELIEYVQQEVNPREIHHTYAGCTVASHCGPGCLGVLFINE